MYTQLGIVLNLSRCSARIGIILAMLCLPTILSAQDEGDVALEDQINKDNVTIAHWRMEGGDTHRTFSTSVAGPGVPFEKWSFLADGIISGGAVLGENGDVYLTSSDGLLHCLTEAGISKWQFDTGAEIQCSPLVNDGIVYLGSGNGNVYALDDAGSLLWTFNDPRNLQDPGIGIAVNPIFTSDDTVLVVYDASSNYDGGLIVALNVNGGLYWAAITGEMHCPSTLAASNERLYVGSDSSTMSALTLKGELIWRVSLPRDYYYNPVVAPGGAILVTGMAEGLMRVNEEGTLEWQYHRDGDFSHISPAVDNDGTAYLGFYSGELCAISPTGELEWSYSTGSMIMAEAIVDSTGQVYVGDRDGIVHALDSEGNLLWQYDTEGDVFAPLSMGADGTLYVCSENRLIAIGDAS